MRRPGHSRRPGASPRPGAQQAATVNHRGHACASPGFHPKTHLGAALLSLRRVEKEAEEKGSASRRGGAGGTSPEFTRGRYAGMAGLAEAPRHRQSHTCLTARTDTRTSRAVALRSEGMAESLEEASPLPSQAPWERLKCRCTHLPLRDSVRGAHAPNIPAAISD